MLAAQFGRLMLATSAAIAASGALAVPVVNYQNFNDVSAFTLNGATASINTGGQGVVGPNPGDQRVLRLTNNVGQSGSAFLTAPFSLASDASFSSYFEFQITRPINGGADGIVFTVQTVSNTAGGGGGGIGYAGIQPSVGVEFDTWDNTGDGINDGGSANHVGINLNGSMNSAVPTPVDAIGQLDGGQIFHAWVDYNGVSDLLEVRLSLDADRPTAALTALNVDLVNVLQTTDAYIGFTSGSGFAGADHDIRRWIFTGEYAPISVPEPTSLALFGAGLAALAVRRRKQRRCA